MIKRFISEARVKRSCKKWLEMYGLQPINNNTGIFKKIYKPVGGGKPRVHKITCGRVGSGDILVCSATGRWVEIECKSSDGRLRPEQKIRQSHIDSKGGLYLVVRCIKDLDAWKEYILGPK